MFAHSGQDWVRTSGFIRNAGRRDRGQCIPLTDKDEGRSLPLKWSSHSCIARGRTGLFVRFTRIEYSNVFVKMRD